MQMLSVDAVGYLNVLRHNCNLFSMDGAEVCIFHEAFYICLCSLLQAYNSAPLEVHIIFAHL